MDGTHVAREDSAASTHPLAYIRRRHGWSYQDLARVIADHARALGVPMAARREKVWRWEHWGVVPEADSQRALARALGIPAREVDARPWPRWLPAHGGMPDGLPWTTEGSLTALASVLDDAAGDPRGFPIADEQALLDAIADWDAAGAEDARHRGMVARDRVPAQATGPVGPLVVDGASLDWLEAGVTGLRRLDDRLGGAAVRHRVEADLRLVSGLLRRELPGRGGRGAVQRLLRVAADLAQLGGWSATDAGRHGAAQRHYLTGLRLAHSAGDRPLAAAVWGGLALQSVIADRPRDALAAAEAAVRAAGGAPRRSARSPPPGWPGRTRRPAPRAPSGGRRPRRNGSSPWRAPTRDRRGCTGWTPRNSPRSRASGCSRSAGRPRRCRCWTGRWTGWSRASSATAASTRPDPARRTPEPVTGRARWRWAGRPPGCPGTAARHGSRPRWTRSRRASTRTGSGTGQPLPNDDRFPRNADSVAS